MMRHAVAQANGGSPVVHVSYAAGYGLHPFGESSPFRRHRRFG